MKVLVTGAGGQVGRELAELALPGVVVHPFARRALDITNEDAIARAFDEVEPDAVVNAAAYTAVDKAESEPELADRINNHAAGLLAKASARAHVPLIHLSTDFVFDGEKGAPYVEDDPINPRGVYATTKAHGEDAVRSACSEHVILRVAWVYSPRVTSNFPMKMLELFRTRDTVSVVTDQRGCPTSASSIAGAVGVILGRGRDVPWGTYHFAGQPAVSRYEWASELLKASGCECELVPVGSEAFPTVAPRPRDSSLDCGRVVGAFGVAPPSWRDGLVSLATPPVGSAPFHS